MGEKVFSVVIFISLMLIIPYLITVLVNGSGDKGNRFEIEVESGRDIVVSIDGENELMDVEEYILGVLPTIVDFSSQMSVIEAQAVAIRSNIYNIMGNKTVIEASEFKYQYHTREEYYNIWGETRYSEIMDVYYNAIKQTQGISE